MGQNNLGKEKKILSDEQIIELYWNRQETAISATDDKYGRFLYTIAYNILNNHMDCEECVDDTYLGAWNRIPPTRPSIFQVFLSRMLRNIAVDRYRRNTASKRVPSELTSSLDEIDEFLPGDYSVETEYRIKEIGRILNKFINSLSERDRFTFVCRYYYADQVDDIARMLQVSGRTVYRSLVRMRESLREELEKEGIDYE